jgi:hypothetical protein
MSQDTSGGKSVCNFANISANKPASYSLDLIFFLFTKATIASTKCK